MITKLLFMYFIDRISFQKMPGSAYYEEPELGGTYSSESELGQLSEEGEETDDASESESYNHQVSISKIWQMMFICWIFFRS